MENLEYPLHLVNQNICPECNDTLAQINYGTLLSNRLHLRCTNCEETFVYIISDRTRPRMMTYDENKINIIQEWDGINVKDGFR